MMWSIGDINGPAVHASFGDGLFIAIHRHPDSSVWMSITSPDSGSIVFDDRRMPIVWLDGDLWCDAGDAMNMTRIVKEYGGGEEHHAAEKKLFGFRIWHGLPQEGYGLLGKLPSARKMRVRLFLLPHNSMDYEIDLSNLGNLLRSAFNMRQ